MGRVAHGLQTLHHGGRHRGFQRQSRRVVDAPARRVGTGLRVQPFHHMPQHHLYVALGLHVATHHTKGHGGLAVLREKRGDDAVQRPFAAVHLVRVAGCSDKTCAPVVQRNTRTGHHHARAKTPVVGLDEGHHTPLCVRRTQVHGAATGRGACGVLARTLRVDAPRTLLQVAAVEQLCGGDVHMGGVGHVRVQVGKCESHGFQLQVHACGGAFGGVLKRQVLQHAQRHQRGQADAVGRDLMHRVAAKRHGDGLNPVGLVVGQIDRRQRRAVLCGKTGNGLRQAAPVEGFTPGGGNVSQCVGLVGKTPDLAHGGCAAARHKCFKAGVHVQVTHRLRPLLCNDGADREAVARVADRIGEQVGKWQCTKALGQGHPARHLAGHGDTVPAASGNGVQPLKTPRVPGGRGAARCVEPVQTPVCPHLCKRVAADAVHDRLHHREGDGRSQRCVDGVAAPGKCCGAGLRGQGLRGGDDVARQNGLAAAGGGGGPVHGVS